MKLTLIRGLPGSGKSTFAKTIPGFHVEADMYFVRDGKYEFDGKSIGMAHSWCARMAENALEKGIDVVVSNTFTQKWELERYIELAKEYFATVEIIVMRGEFGSVHGVPPETIELMRRRWEE
jgi:predicted kinase